MPISFEIRELFSMATVVMVLIVHSLTICNLVMHQHINCNGSHVMNIQYQLNQFEVFDLQKCCEYWHVVIEPVVIEPVGPVDSQQMWCPVSCHTFKEEVVSLHFHILDLHIYLPCYLWTPSKRMYMIQELQ